MTLKAKSYLANVSILHFSFVTLTKYRYPVTPVNTLLPLAQTKLAWDPTHSLAILRELIYMFSFPSVKEAPLYHWWSG